MSLRGSGLSIARLSGGAAGISAPGAYFATPAYSSANHTMAANELYATPFVAPGSFTVSELAIHCHTAVVGNAKFGIYTSSLTDGLPDLLLAENNADVSTNVTGTTIAGTFASPPQMVPGRVFWATAVFSAAAGVVGFNQASLQCGGLHWPFSNSGNFAFIASSNPSRYTRALTYVAGSPFLPASFGAVTTAGGAPASPIFRLRRNP